MSPHRQPSKWYEIVIGTTLLATSVYHGWHLIYHPPPDNLVVAWTFVGVTGLWGAQLVSPYRAQYLLSELRRILPWLDGRSHRDRDRGDK